MMNKDTLLNGLMDIRKDLAGYAACGGELNGRT